MLWHGLLGTPTRTRRHRLRAACLAILIALFGAPLWLGVLHVLFGSLP